MPFFRTTGQEFCRGAWHQDGVHLPMRQLPDLAGSDAGLVERWATSRRMSSSIWRVRLCNEVITQGRTHFVPCGVENVPQGSRAGKLSRLPIFSHAGEVIGHLACFDTEEMQDDLPPAPIFTILRGARRIEIEQRLLTGRRPWGTLDSPPWRNANANCKIWLVYPHPIFA